MQYFERFQILILIRKILSIPVWSDTISYAQVAKICWICNRVCQKKLYGGIRRDINQNFNQRENMIAKFISGSSMKW